jgi:phenylalanine-4-hydroxylase
MSVDTEAPVSKPAGTGAPANHGQSGHGLRGDYSRMRADYTVDQDYAAYTPSQQGRWRRLYRRQIECVPGRACGEYLHALSRLDEEDAIPRFEAVNDKLEAHELTAGGGHGARASSLTGAGPRPHRRRSPSS